MIKEKRKKNILLKLWLMNKYKMCRAFTKEWLPFQQITDFGSISQHCFQEANRDSLVVKDLDCFEMGCLVKKNEF